MGGACVMEKPVGCAIRTQTYNEQLHVLPHEQSHGMHSRQGLAYAQPMVYTHGL